MSIDRLDLRLTAAADAEIVRGRHYNEWRPQLDRLAGRDSRKADYEALSILIDIMDAVETSSGLTGASMPTWHVSMATWLARRNKDYRLESWFYQRWETHEHDEDRRNMWAARHQRAWERALAEP